MTELQVELECRLRMALSPSELEVIDESHQHAGHAGAAGGAKHFAVRIVSPKFIGKTRMAQHRMVYAAVDDLMPFPIHALRIETV
ncbi:BolA family protein [Hydromonas duriensis]|uniref:BolA protein family transcriptional regulator n=1 Tax=Hydromonas duriensis TaxID=1527608 RepID=A0A4R6YBP6_9BURK|nr:BolA/IbaG family iron-sulfur metabolism protein [Hydromonas duriensis]TDR33117.1 BolA protein family transcriptional regulator [Hydromonas duriensis]